MAKKKMGFMEILKHMGWFRIIAYLLIIFGALTYLALAVDLIPDSIPIFGYADDAIVIGMAVMLMIRLHHRKSSAKLWGTQ